MNGQNSYGKLSEAKKARSGGSEAGFPCVPQDAADIRAPHYVTPKLFRSTLEIVDDALYASALPCVLSADLMQTDRSLSARGRTRGSGAQDRLELYEDLWLEVHSCELKPLQWPSGLHSKHETDRMDPSKWGVFAMCRSQNYPRASALKGYEPSPLLSPEPTDHLVQTLGQVSHQIGRSAGLLWPAAN